MVDAIAGKSCVPQMNALSHRWPLGLTRRTWPLFVVGLVVLLAAIVGFDAGASQAAIHWPANVRAVFSIITNFGLSDWILIPSLILFVVAAVTTRFRLRGGPKLLGAEITAIAAFVFIGVGLPGLVANLLKRIIGRGRPELFDAVGPFGFQNVFNDYTYQSFPSGHTTTSFAFACVIGFLWPRLFPWLLVAAVLVGFSRVPVGMHYPTDVLGGIVVGTLGAYAVRNAFAERRLLFTKKPDGRIYRRHRVLKRWLGRKVGGGTQRST